MAPEARLPRRRLVAPLAAALEGRIGVIRGEAGTGKSTLLELLEDELRVPVTRVALADARRDLGKLLQRLRDALELPVPDERLEEGAPGALAVLACLRKRAPFVLALDDLHGVDEDGPAADFLGLLVKRLPRDASLLLLSRGRLPLALAPLRAAGRLHEIGPADLRLSADETRELCAQLAPDAPLDEAGLARLYEITGGWLVAVILFTAALVHGDARSALEELAGAREAVSEFLSEAVLRPLPDRMVRQLERAAVLEPFDAEVLAEVCGEDASATLRAARAQQLLVSGTDGGWTFSGLLGDALRGRLASDPDAWKETNLLAARVRERRSELERAIDHLIEAGELDAATRLLVSTGFANLQPARIRRLERHFDGLGRARVEANPALRFLHATIGMLGRDTATGALAEFEAVGRDASLGPLAAAARARVANMRLWQGDMALVEEWSRRALELAPPLPDGVAVYAHGMREFALRQLGRDADADAHAEALTAAQLPWPEAAIPIFYRALWLRARGHADRARELALGALERVRSDGRLSAATFLLVAAQAALDAGALEEALGLAQQGITEASLDEAPWWAMGCRQVRAAALAGLGRSAEARDEAERLAEQSRAWNLLWISVETLLVLARVAEDGGAALASARELVSNIRHPSLYARVAIALAREALDDHRIDAADRLLEEARAELGCVDSEAVRRELALVEARIALARGDRRHADARVAENLGAGQALRTEQRHLLPALLRLAEAGDLRARQAILDGGAASLRGLRGARSELAERLGAALLDAAAGPLEVRSLGALEVVRRPRGSPAQEIVTFRSARVADLFRLLLLRGLRAPVAQDVLVEALWPDTGEAGLNRFQTHLSYLRRALEPHAPARQAEHYLTREGAGYRLDLRGGRWDAADFEAGVRAGLRALADGDPAAARERLDAALLFYRGPLFADQPDLPDAQPWRTRLADLHVEAQLAVARLAREAGDYLVADDHLECLLTESPGVEEAWRLRFELALDRGRPDRIPALFDACRRALAEQLDAEPSAETVRLATTLQVPIGRARVRSER